MGDGIIRYHLLTTSAAGGGRSIESAPTSGAAFNLIIPGIAEIHGLFNGAAYLLVFGPFWA